MVSVGSPPQTATYNCTALVGTNKAGLLKPDEDGYYTVVLGALNVYNSAGAFYPYESAKQIFKESSSLMRRIANGTLRGEYGHPKKLPGMSMRDFVNRILEIHEENVSHHIKEVTIDYSSVKDKDGRPVIAIIGKIKPCGPMGKYLKESLDNPNENVCFSIRSLTQDVRVGGVIHKNLRTIVSWDYVNEPGISTAMKWHSPALESIDNEVYITATCLGSVRDLQKAAGISMENGNTVSVEEVINELGWNEQDGKKVPASMNW